MFFQDTFLENFFRAKNVSKCFFEFFYKKSVLKKQFFFLSVKKIFKNLFITFYIFLQNFLFKKKCLLNTVRIQKRTFFVLS